MSKIKLGKKLDQKTKKALTISNGTPVYLYKFIPNKLNSISHYLFINKFDSIREVGRYLSISQSTVSRYLKSGDLFKNNFKFSYTLL